ncbi:MAG: SAM-dependent methyltransferase [Clostridia bacterium]|nr:SAM-dependent methyltransferase [Clostridia bacterium]
MTDSLSRFELLFEQASTLHALKKLTLSKPLDPAIQKTVITLRAVGNTEKWQAETFHSDNKVTHDNLDLDQTESVQKLLSEYRQANLMTTVGDCEMRISKSGTVTLLGFHPVATSLSGPVIPTVPVLRNENRKQYILSGSEPFLVHLGISDANGRVHDKRQSKFRQINRFLELIRDIEPHLGNAPVLRIADLCCGKSYLSFAVYHYFSVIRGRSVEMVGVDLKPDVIAFCEKTARELHFNDLHFFCDNVFSFDPAFHPDLVLSLHACDTATDAVLEKAMAWDTPVILSTPCCQHELNHKLNCPELDFIARHSMLRQKFCEAATDALRLLLLEANGYSVTALELIDPEETPKNILLRGIRRKGFDPASPEAVQKRAEYARMRNFLMQEPRI